MQLLLYEAERILIGEKKVEFNTHTVKTGKAGSSQPSKPLFFQPKLTINQPNDVYEREADHMADKVMRMTDASINQSTFFKPTNNTVQRKCQACEEEEKHVHRKEGSTGEVQGSSELDSYIGSLHSTGQPIPEKTRSFFEPRFGRDFSNVRLHTGAVAAKSAQSINALAYTSGNNIVFNTGQYSPDSDSGKKLMAHELTHVVQQNGNIQPKLIQRQSAGDPAQNDPNYHSPTYVQPGGPFDTNDTIPTITCDADGCRLGVPVPFAAPGADSLGFPVYCAPGRRRALDSNGLLVCCPVARINTITNACCDDGQVGVGSTCGDPGSVAPGPTVPGPRIPQPGVPGSLCPPGQQNLATGECCAPPTVPYLRGCVAPAPAPPVVTPAQGISGTFPAGTIDDFDIDATVLNRRQTGAYQSVLASLRLVLRSCPGTIVTITGFTDAPGTPEHNTTLAQNRADNVRLRLQMDLMTLQQPAAPSATGRGGGASPRLGGELPNLQVNIPPLFLTRSEGSANPVDTSAGTGYSARNRRVEVSMTMQCPPLTPATR